MLCPIYGRVQLLERAQGVSLHVRLALNRAPRDVVRLGLMLNHVVGGAVTEPFCNPHIQHQDDPAVLVLSIHCRAFHGQPWHRWQRSQIREIERRRPVKATGDQEMRPLMAEIERPASGETNVDDTRDMSYGECRIWLDHHSEGRLGYIGGRGPRSVVVSYAVTDDQSCSWYLPTTRSHSTYPATRSRSRLREKAADQLRGTTTRSA